jgi:hypothetical protein
MSQEPEMTVDDEMRPEYDFLMVYVGSTTKRTNSRAMLWCLTQT